MKKNDVLVNNDPELIKSYRVKKIEDKIAGLRAGKQKVNVFFDGLILLQNIWIDKIKSLEKGMVKDGKN